MTAAEFFVVCLEAGADDDLLVGRVYRACEDPAGERSGFIRVWDASGEDYLYPSEHFVRLSLAGWERERLAAALSSP